jgi:hypothetical protein
VYQSGKRNCLRGRSGHTQNERSVFVQRRKW